MAKFNIVTDKVNNYFTANKITIGTAAPTSGTHVAGDMVLCSAATNDKFGWICSKSGTPGTWIELSGVNIKGNAATATKLKNSRTLKIGNTGKSFDGSENVTWNFTEMGVLPLVGGSTYPMTGSIYMNNGKGIYGTTASDLVNSAGETIAAGTTSSILMFNSSHNLHIGALINEKKLINGTTYMYGASNMQLKVNDGNINLYPSNTNTWSFGSDKSTTNKPINTSVATGSYLKGNQGTALLNSTASAGSYVTVAKTNSTNGYFTLNGYQKGAFLNYTAKETVDAESNAVTYSLKLLDESGNSSFPGIITTTGEINFNMYDRTSSVFNIYDGGQYGFDVVFSGAGNTIVAGGEAGANLMTAGEFTSGGEVLALASDTFIEFFTNCNDIDSRVSATLNKNLYFYPNTAVTGSIGHASYPWASSYYKNMYLQTADNTYGSFRTYTEGTTDTQGDVRLYIGNNKATGTEGNARGRIILYGTGTGYTWLNPGYNEDSSITVTLPSGGGTLARTVDNVASATKLQTARTLTIGNTGKTFDGTGPVSWTLSEIGAAASGHTHDDRYYTESEITSLLSGKSDTGHTHDDRYYTESEITSLLSGKANSSHTHDDRYYTETEVNNLLSNRVDWTTYNAFVGKFYIQDSRMLYMCSWDPGAIGAGNVWIKCG